MTAPTPDVRRAYLHGIAHAIALVSIRCRLIGPTSLALDLTSTRSAQVLRFEIQRFIAAGLLKPTHWILGQLSQLTEEDMQHITVALPVVAGSLWADFMVDLVPTNHLLP